MGLNTPKIIDVDQHIPAVLVDSALELWNQSCKQSWIPISGPSMQPALQDCDLVQVQHGPVRLRRGDIIVFRSENIIVVHRILRIYQQGGNIHYLTKGDNSNNPDALVASAQVIGRVDAISRDGRHMSLQCFPLRARNWLIGTSAWIFLKFRKLINSK